MLHMLLMSAKLICNTTHCTAYNNSGIRYFFSFIFDVVNRIYVCGMHDLWCTNSNAQKLRFAVHHKRQHVNYMALYKCATFWIFQMKKFFRFFFWFSTKLTLYSLEFIKDNFIGKNIPFHFETHQNIPFGTWYFTSFFVSFPIWMKKKTKPTHYKIRIKNQIHCFNAQRELKCVDDIHIILDKLCVGMPSLAIHFSRIVRCVTSAGSNGIATTHMC